MIFFCDNSGAIFKTVPEKIYQGSINANTIYLVGAFDGDCVVTARFELPNGLLTTEKLLKSSYTALNNDIQTEDGIAYNVWAYVLKSDITALSGTVGVQFTVTSQNENGMAATVCTARSTFDVERGVPVLQDDSAINYETLLTQIKAVLTALQQGDTENSIASAASAEAARISAKNAAEAEQQALAAQESAQASAESASQSETIVAGAVSQIQSYIKQTEQNTLNITNIQAVLQGNSQYALITLSQAYTSRFTANGANIFDGQLTPVESIKGSTVKCKNIFDINTTPHLSYPTYTTYSVDEDTVKFISTIANNSFYYKLENVLEVGKIYTFSVDSIAYTGGAIGIWLGTTAAVDANEYSKRIVTPSGSITFTATSSDLYIKAYINYSLATSGQTIFTFSKPMLVEGSQVLPYQPYFTGLKNANINSIVSTGKNLFSLDKFMEVQTSTNITRNGEDLVVRSQSYQEKYTVYNFPVVLNTATMSLECETTRNTGDANFSFRFIYEDGTLERKMITLGQVGNIQKIIFSTNKNVVAWGVGDWQYNGDVVLRNIQIQIGNTATEYEPYTTYAYQLPQTVELAEFDIINPPEQTLTRYTATKVFEITQGVWAMLTEGLFRYEAGISNADFSQPAGKGVCNLFDFNAEQSGLTNTWFFKDGELYFVKNDITTLNDWIAFLSTQETNGNPLTLSYKTAEPVSTTIFAAPEAYEVYNGGTETIVQGTTDNSEYGAKPTITQTYLGKVGE